MTTRGREFIGADRKPIFLRGINLGNWLLPEGYMFKFKTASSPRLIGVVLNQLIGEDEARRFWKTYRDNYVTAEDIRFIKRAGFNSVRVPFSYRLFVSEDDPRRLEGPGYELLDRVVGWCFWPYKKLDATSCVASVVKPADWDTVVAFADHPRTTFEEVRKNRPPREKVERALVAYLEGVKFDNCKVNEGYLKALGLR